MSMENLLKEEELSLLRSTLEGAGKILITCHTNPDGDALGSMTALMSVLRRRGKEVVGVAPDRWPDNLEWLPLMGEVRQYLRHEEEVKDLVKDVDLVLMLDHGRLDRMAELGEAVAGLQVPRIVMDHHPQPEEGALLTLCYPSFCAAAEVVYKVLDQLGWTQDMTADEATGIYCGLMTDTGAFAYNSNRPELYRIIASLLEKGIDKDHIYRKVFWASSADRYRLLGYLLYVKMEILHEYHAAIITFTNQERKHFQLKNGETDGIVNYPLMIGGMRLSIFLREDTEKRGVIRVSLRSVDDVPCHDISAEFFQGGGHRNASGGRLNCSMEEAVEVAKKAIRKYAEILKK